MESEARLVMIDYRLPPPELQYEIRGRHGELWRVDFAWPEARVAAEYESIEWHAGRLEMLRDKARFACVQELGWTIIPIVIDDVRRYPDRLAERIDGHLAAPRLRVRELTVSRRRMARRGLRACDSASARALRRPTRLADVLIGSHVNPKDPLAAAEAENADVVQIFLGNPQSWKTPQPREDAARLKASSVPVYVHAPYLINVASANNRVRIPSRKILQDTCNAAADIGAAAVIVHGGHVAEDNDLQAGFERWRKALDRLETNVPLYLENTAGGDHAMARHFATLARLWEHIGDAGIGFCLDTCHVWAAGEALVDAVERIKGITGRIDLVHCNDSKDAAGSGRDRHANFGTGQIDPELLVAVVRAAGAPVICETADVGRKDDIAFLRERLS
jgi:deoxyribonuclease-4